MSHYVLRKAPAGASGHVLFGLTMGTLRPSPDGMRFVWGQVPPQTFTSVAAWRRWFERQGHTVEVLT